MATDTLDGPAFVTNVAPAEPLPSAGQLGIAEVYEAHFDYVHRCLRGLGVLPPALDDAVQDVFLVVQDKLPEFDGKARLSTWLYAIVLRVARRYRERAAKDSQRFVPDDELGAAPADALEQNEQLAVARRALAALDQDKREVFVLALVEQMSAPEIAVVLGVPLNTVYSRLRAARAAFGAQVARMRNGTTKRRSP